MDSPAFLAALEENFPGTMQYEEGIFTAYTVLKANGYCRTNSIALVSQCRDELTRPFVNSLDLLYGSSFCISSLAGMVFCGKTGFLAAMHHAPQDEKGTERYVFYVGPHIAISSEGKIGECMRPGRSSPSGACGSLMAFHAEMKSGHVDVRPDPVDLEQVMVKQKLLGKLPFGQVPSLVGLTKAALTATVEDVTAVLESVIEDNARYAIVSGVLIHGPDGNDFFWTSTVQAQDDDGKMVDLSKAIHGVSPEDFQVTSDIYHAKKNAVESASKPHLKGFVKALMNKTASSASD